MMKYTEIEFADYQLLRDPVGLYKIIGEENSYIRYVKNGISHRRDGPAFEWADGEKYYCYEGGFHRSDGPAIIYSSSSSVYFYKNNEYSKEEFTNQLSEDELKSFLLNPENF